MISMTKIIRLYAQKLWFVFLLSALVQASLYSFLPIIPERLWYSIILFPIVSAFIFYSESNLTKLHKTLINISINRRVVSMSASIILVGLNLINLLVFSLIDIIYNQDIDFFLYYYIFKLVMFYILALDLVFGRKFQWFNIFSSKVQISIKISISVILGLTFLMLLFASQINLTFGQYWMNYVDIYFWVIAFLLLLFLYSTADRRRIYA